MKSRYVAAGVMLLGSFISAAGAQAAGTDETLCRGTYPVLLMTEQECHSYIQQIKVLQSTGQDLALASLQQHHTEQLVERAAICPCMEPKPKAAAPQRVVMLDPDC